MLKEIIANVKFAMENGFTDVKVELLNKEEVLLVGAFGQVVIGADELPEVLEVIVAYKNKECVEAVEETTEAVEVAETKEEATQTETVVSFEGLTEKEMKVLEAMHYSEEYGLPVFAKDITKRTGLSARSIVGVMSSLNKKGYTEDYDNERMLGVSDCQMLKEEVYDALTEIYGL